MADHVRVKVLRYDPASSEPPRYQSYNVPTKPGMVVGEALEYIYEYLDSTLAFRYECRTRQCGSCLMQVDGEPRLACKELLGDRPELTLEPLGNLPIVRDLVTDRSPALAPLYQLLPFRYKGEDGAVPVDHGDGPRPISVLGMERVKLAEECAECTLCTEVCPAYSSGDYAGPMLFNKLARLTFHEADAVDRKAEARRLAIHRCKSCFRCEEICPHELPVRQFAISRLLGNSRSYEAFKLGAGEEP